MHFFLVERVKRLEYMEAWRDNEEKQHSSYLKDNYF